MQSATNLKLQFDAFELDEADARLKKAGQAVPLPPKAFAVLCALARQPGVLVTKANLLDAVWGHQHVSESVLKTTISQVRAALADDAQSPRFIETASRLGYRFIGKAAEPAPAVPASAVPVMAVVAEAAAAPSTLIGRRAPLARLTESWRRANGGQRQIVWLAGDAGVGKTTLLDAFLREVAGAAVIYGQCVEQHGAGEPYLPVLQGLAELTRDHPQVLPLLRGVAPTWLVQMPWLTNEAERASLARELAGTGAERMVREMNEFAARLSETLPVVFVIEDLHWCDQATLALMDFFARQRGRARVMWLGTYRLTQVIAENHPLQALRQELKLHRLCEEVVLDAFSEVEVMEYLRSRMSVARLDEGFVRRIHAHTDGLPLFLVNVVDALVGAEVETSETSRQRALASSQAALPVPEDLTGAVERRIGKLPADDTALLEAAAVCGVEFRAGTVAAALELPLAQVIAACDALVRRQYWLKHSATVDLPDGSLDARYTFRHAIYRHVFNERIGPAPRIQLNRRIAQELTRAASAGVAVAPIEIATHLEAGRELGRALAAYAQAAQSALRHFAPVQAIEICEHAGALLAQLPAVPEKLGLELAIKSAHGVAVAQVHGVGSEATRPLFERVRELWELMPNVPNPETLVSGLGSALFARAEYDNILLLADRIDAINPERASRPLFITSCLMRGASMAARGECREAANWWRRAIAACEEVKDRSAFASFVVDPEVAIRANSVRTFYERGLADRARREIRLALDCADKLGQPLAQTLAHWRAGMLEVRLGNASAVRAHGDAIAEIVRRTCISQGEGPSYYFRGWADAHEGDPRRGYEQILQGLDYHLRIGMQAGCTEVMGYAAEALVLAKDWDGATAQLAAAFARSEKLGERVNLPILKLLSARVALGRGNRKASYRELLEARDLASLQEAPGFELKVGVELLAHPDCTAADREGLRDLLGAITEGHDIPDYLAAKTALAT
jgi:DNA-binding winged helix-turn-helix (wHTH) protein/tetratricopeptide (TPR) repeat protein